MNAKDSTNPLFNIFSTGNGLKREEITWEKGKEGKWRRNKSLGGIRRPLEPMTAFHATARAHMSGRLTWKPRQVVHLNKFYKGDPFEMSTEEGISNTSRPCSSSSITNPSRRHFHLHSHLHHHSALSSISYL
jgi:hypothetical protein